MCVCVSFAAKKFGVTEVPMEAVTFISHATQSRLRTVVEKVSTIAQHRLDSCKVREKNINNQSELTASQVTSTNVIL